MKKTIFRLTLLGVAAMLTVVSCNKDKDNDPKPSPNNNNNNNNNGVTIVDPGTSFGAKGSITFTYNGEKVTYPSVRAKDGKIWMQQNLGAQRVATSMTDVESYGDLYQWGRWADGHQLRTPAPTVTAASTLSANNPSGLPAGGSKAYISGWWNGGASTDTWNAATSSGVSATNGCDPCKVLGSDWRLPTEEDWDSVLDAEGITDNATAYASNLKIPAGGWRATNSPAIASAGTSSWYWSSKASGSNGAKGIWIQSSSVRKSYEDARAYGTSVRCVKD